MGAAAQAAELDPGWPAAWVTLSRAQYNLGEPELALRSAEEALAQAPLDPDARQARADAEAVLRGGRSGEQRRRAWVTENGRLAVGPLVECDADADAEAAPEP